MTHFWPQGEPVLVDSDAVNRVGRLMVLTGRSSHSAAVMLVSMREFSWITKAARWC